MMMRYVGMLVAASLWVAGLGLADGFDTGFEVTEVPALIAGDELHRAGGDPLRWNWAGNDVGTVSAKPDAVHQGSQGLDATRRTTGDSQAWWTRPGIIPELTGGTVSIRAAIQAVGWEDHPDSFLEIAASDIRLDDLGPNETRSAWISLKGNGRLYAWDGGMERELAAELAVDQWVVVEVIIDVTARTYRVLLNDREVGTGMAYFGSGAGAVRSWQFKEYNRGKSSGGVYVDDVSVRWQNQ